MDIIDRIAKSNLLKSQKSILLLGPRQTGKSTLLNSIFPEAYGINLADEQLYLAYASDPGLLARRLKPLTPNQPI